MKITIKFGEPERIAETDAWFNGELYNNYIEDDIYDDSLVGALLERIDDIEVKIANHYGIDYDDVIHDDYGLYYLTPDGVYYVDVNVERV